MANYADDNTIYSVVDKVTNLLKTLETETNQVLKWFRINEMKANDDKCYLLVANQENVSVTLGNEIIEATNSVELLGVSNLCKKRNQTLHALARISKYLSKDKLKMKTFVQSQFNYCPITWMFHNRTLNDKINKLHEGALRIFLLKMMT